MIRNVTHVGIMLGPCARYRSRMPIRKSEVIAHPAYVEAVDGVPVCNFAQVAPVDLALGVVLGVDPVPVDPRGNADAAGVAVFVLTSVRRHRGVA